MESNTQGVGSEMLADTVFERVKPEMVALKATELLPIKLDLSQAVATVLGVLPEVRGLREQIVKELPSFDIQRFDKLEDYALALSYAHAKFLSATQPPDDLDELSTESLKLRERLLAEVKALVQHGVVSEAQIAQLKGANGYKNVATDLMVLTNIIRVAWPQIQGKVLTTSQNLEQALKVAARLLRVVGLREQGPVQVAEATDERLRAFTLLFFAYDDARRAVAYLRAAQGDADDIAPSLYPGRPRPSKKDAKDKEGEATVPDGAAHTGVVAGGVTAPPAHPAAPSPAAKEGNSVPADAPFLT